RPLFLLIEHGREGRLFVRQLRCVARGPLQGIQEATLIRCLRIETNQDIAREIVGLDALDTWDPADLLLNAARSLARPARNVCANPAWQGMDDVGAPIGGY